MRIPSGTTDQVIYFVAVDSTDLTTRETGLTTFTVYRDRNGAGAAAMTTPTVTEVDASNMPGVYKLLLDEDMTIGSGNDSEEMAFHITQASMAPVTRTIELYRPKITVGETLDDMSIADAVWDEARSGHVTAGTFGEAAQVVRSGTAQAGANFSITLDASASATSTLYRGQMVTIQAGTGSGQSRIIFAYNGTTKVATISPQWITNPDSSSVFVIRESGQADVRMWNGGVPNDLVNSNVPVNLDASGLATDAAEEIASAVLDEAYEGTTTLRQFLRLAASAMFGKLSGAATTTVAIRDEADTKDRITATVDADGNRSAVTLDKS